MKKKLIFLLSLCLATTMAKAEQVVLQTKNTTMVLNVENGKQPQCPSTDAWMPILSTD